MTQAPQARRTLLVAGAATVGAALTTGVFGLLAPLRAQGLAPTPTMRGGDNNYRPGAPIVNRIGNGGFWLTGTVRRAGDGAPLPRVRIQMWAHTTEGHERDPHSHGATLTDANGVFRMEMRMLTSTMLTASSATTTLGSVVSARAIDTRCRCPPES